MITHICGMILHKQVIIDGYVNHSVYGLSDGENADNELWTALRPCASRQIHYRHLKSIMVAFAYIQWCGAFTPPQAKIPV